MRAAFLHGVGDLRIDDVAAPTPGEGEVLVRVRSVGVCGSDVHYYARGRIGEYVVEGPQILGHEAAGEVVELGRGAEGFEVGDKVALEPGIPCGGCEECRRGMYNLCAGVRFLGTPPVPGAYSEYIAYPAAWCHRLGEGMTYDDGAMVEPLAIALFALDEAPIAPGESVAIFGCGPVGLLIMQVARAAGAGEIYASEPIGARRELALAMGAKEAFSPCEEDVVGRIMEATGGRGVDLAVEAAGAMETYGQAVSSARMSGTALFVGIPEEDEITIPAHTARRHAVRIVNLRRSRWTHERAIKMVEQGAVDVRRMVTHRFALADIDEAFQLVRGYEDGVIRAMIEIQ